MRTLPHNDEAEKAILGALLMREDAYDTVSGIINASDFYQPMNGVIYTDRHHHADRSPPQGRLPR